MSKPLELSPSEWDKLKTHLLNQYPPSVMLISSRTRAVLGFTVREHEKYVLRSIPVNKRIKRHLSPGYYETVIHLDFWDEPKRTMFLLKYSEFLL